MQQVEDTENHDTIQALLLKLVGALKGSNVEEQENITKELEQILLAIKKADSPPQDTSAPMVTDQSTQATPPVDPVYSSTTSSGSYTSSYANSGSTASTSPTIPVSTPLSPKRKPSPPAQPAQTDPDLIKNFINLIQGLNADEKTEAIATLIQALGLSSSGNGAYANQGVPPPPPPPPGCIPPPPPLPPPPGGSFQGTKVPSALHQQQEEKEQKIADLKDELSKKIDPSITNDDATIMYEVTITAIKKLDRSKIHDIFKYYLRLKKAKQDGEITIELNAANVYKIHKIYKDLLAARGVTITPKEAVETYIKGCSMIEVKNGRIPIVKKAIKLLSEEIKKKNVAQENSELKNKIIDRVSLLAELAEKSTEVDELSDIKQKLLDIKQKLLDIQCNPNDFL
ncbi:MAG: hypothetical protein K2X94_02005 [Amoebophilaceae bacterium]|nr:hypothetical protein [Amoebophilaceae bacterium]